VLAPMTERASEGILSESRWKGTTDRTQREGAPAGIPTRKPRPARAGPLDPFIQVSPAKSGEQLRLRVLGRASLP
jgi:hypothetical protein